MYDTYTEEGINNACCNVFQLLFFFQLFGMGINWFLDLV